MVIPTEPKDDMTSLPLTPVRHPFSLGGKARLLWLGTQLSRDISSILTILLIGAVARWWTEETAGTAGTPLPEAILWTGVAATLILGWAAPRYLHWLAWAEVPGAYRTFTWRDEHQTPPTYLPEHLALTLNTAIWVGGGIWLSTFAPTLVGLLGGCFLARFVYDLGGSIYRRICGEEKWTRMGAFRLAVLSTVPLAWTLLGDGLWTAYTFWLFLMFFIILTLGKTFLGPMTVTRKRVGMPPPRVVAVSPEAKPLPQVYDDTDSRLPWRTQLALDAVMATAWGLGWMGATLLMSETSIGGAMFVGLIVALAWMAAAPPARMIARPRVQSDKDKQE